MVAVLLSDQPSEPNVGQIVSPDVTEAQADSIAAAFAPGNLESISLTAKGMLCHITIDMRTQESSIRSGVDGTRARLHGDMTPVMG